MRLMYVVHDEVCLPLPLKKDEKHDESNRRKRNARTRRSVSTRARR